MALPHWELIGRLLLAAGLGSVIGLERERLLWAAGLRTHMLVCVGAALMIIVSAYGFNAVLGRYVVLDPSRVAAQVVSGVGFLGAGSIILRNDGVKGLTTAASIWAVAGVGLAAGAGLYVAAVAATVIMLAILAGLKPLEERYRASRTSVEFQMEARRGEISVAMLREALGGRAERIKQLVVRGGADPDLDDVTLVLDRISHKDTAAILRALESLPSVRRVSQKAA